MNQFIDHLFLKSDAILGSREKQQLKMKSRKSLLKERRFLMLKVIKNSQITSPIQEYSTMEIKFTEEKADQKKKINSPLSKDIKRDM